MRSFFLVLILIFGLQSWTKADDIRDFEIEGMSVGDSLLNYMSLEKLNSSKNLCKITIQTILLISLFLKSSR